jgi:type II restriction/modification system DNA methylase subunit YeeA
MQTQVTKLLLSGRKVTKATPRDQNPIAVFEAFLDRLRRVRVLDPACGSGNFLIVSLWALKDLEFEAIQWGSLVLQRPMQVPQIGPEAVLGIEINPYAAELARVTIWIGEIQWMIRHGLGYRRDPILRRLDHIETRDALLNLTDPARPQEAEWPVAEFIVGNPPFLGRKFLRGQLSDAYVDALYRVFKDRLPHAADFVCYWHEMARRAISNGATRRAGLLATQNIRGGPNQRVLRRIKESGDIFFARSDEPWILSGAAVHISFVAQDDGSDFDRELDGTRVDSINPDLTTGLNLTRAHRLTSNLGTAFQGVTFGGPFNLSELEAIALLSQPNPDGRTNADVIRPILNAKDITSRTRRAWAIDFGPDRPEAEAALYEGPFEHIRRHVLGVRQLSRRKAYADRWWLPMEARPGLRAAVSGLSRFIVTPITSKHRIFVWAQPPTLPMASVVTIARDDDYTFGVLQSKIHELWARGTGTQLREVESGFRYTATSTFETFPFPSPSDDERRRVGEAAKRLVQLRDGWLSPPGLAFGELENRTMTDLYNQRPTWLGNAHSDLDASVLNAYGWPADSSNPEILGRLLDLNLKLAGITETMPQGREYP